jgi:DNA mismatch repair ATPase MutS
VLSYEAYAAALCLDGPTLANLELLEGSDGSAQGSLLATLDTCASPGARAPACCTITSLPCA